MAHKQAHEARQRESHKKPRRPQPSLLERIQPDAAGVDCGERSHFVAVPVSVSEILCSKPYNDAPGEGREGKRYGSE